MVSDARFSKDSLFEFIDFVDKKGLVKHSRARNWRSAAKNLLSILNEDESSDLRSIDIDELINRYSNINANKVRGSSIQVYKSRFTSALENFMSWAEDPVNYKPDVNSRANDTTSRSETSNTKQAGKKETQKGQSTETHTAKFISSSDSVVFPVPLSDGRVVTIHNLPNNLNKKDADKLCAVIKALGLASDYD